MNMKLTDLMPVADWAALEDELAARFGLQSAAYNPDGKSVTGRNFFASRLCETLKSRPAALSTICAAANLNFMAEARATCCAVISECDAGLAKVAVPVFVDGQFLGTVGGCGKLPEGGEAEEFLIAKTTGLSEEEAASLCRDIGLVGREKLEEMAGFLKSRLAEILSQAKNSGRI